VENKATEWASLVAKLVAGGRTFDDVARFTLKQAESVLANQAEEFKNQARLQGCTFKDDDKEEATYDNFSDGFKAMKEAFG